ncbi:MAG TPA: rhodanese-like domain-containing protein [Candidatus Saccharibacteria bacterium]|nr:rhodanese-like domain-containing protein [Candidatus Saccharibacteria bacterium]HRN96972.1 rhodanese-like domain-containing protein [Candidatus Saccharibacteria bacterium]HRQ07145.1 rhodanese-like domain-containing protein [Candidatus Saccharibacteria bacterium]HRQ98039.1 rhodanese-like domain-containing protein [Candidatus Saccharibacteria bacterium]
MNQSRIIIDVREPFEYESGHVDGAINIPPGTLMSGSSGLENVKKDTELVLYCKTGSRSAASMQILKQMGFTNLVNGINAGHVNKNFF